MRVLSVEEISSVDGGWTALELASDLGVISGVLWTGAEVSALGLNPVNWTVSGILGVGAAVTATGAAAIVAYYAYQ